MNRTRPGTPYILAIVFAASLVPAFDYAVGRVEADIRLGRYQSFESMRSGAAPEPYRYRILVPYAIAPVVDLAATVWPRETAFHRVDGVFDLLVITALLFAIWLYLSIWFTSDQALVGALLVGCTLPISLRHHLYAPYSLVEPVLLLLGFLCVYRGRLGWVMVVTILASLNRETAFLIPLGLLAYRLQNRQPQRHAMVVGIAALVVSVMIPAALRVWLGSTPSSISLGAIRDVNLSNEGMSAAIANVFLFAGGTGWLLAARGWSRAPRFVRQLTWLPVIYLPLYLVAGVWYEVRLLMPLYPWLLPSLMASFCVPNADSSGPPIAKG